jgi:hypothetical protein
MASSPELSETVSWLIFCGAYRSSAAMFGGHVISWCGVIWWSQSPAAFPAAWLGDPSK